MENLSHYSRHPNSSSSSAAAAAAAAALSVSKKNKSCSNGATTANFASASKSVYDDVFGGPPKFGAAHHSTATTLSPRAEDYKEIFGAFHVPRASSIPVLDLPSVDGEAEMLFDVRNPGFDYREVFGGFSCPDIAVSYDELVRMDRSNGGRGCSSSDEAWTPEGAEYLSEESDDPAKAQYISNGDFYVPVDGSMEFNVSYQKASQRSDGDLPNGTTHVAPLHHAFPGYAVKVDESGSLQSNDGEHPNLLVSDDGHLDIDFSGEMMNGRHLMKTMSQPSFASNGKTSGGFDIRSQREYNRNISLPGKDFVTITEFNLKTEPSHLPPPARPPPGVDVGMKNSDKLGVPSHKAAAREQVSSDCSPPYFDVEVDASSAAAASAAAMKEAMEKAQAKLKSAKESLERKRDGSHRRAGSGSKTGRRDKEGKVPQVADGLRNAKDDNVYGKENGGEFFSLTETQNVEKTADPVSDSLHRQRNNVSLKTAEEMSDRGSLSSQGYDDTDGAGEWKEAGQFFELVREKFDKPSDQANNENIPLENINVNGHEKKGKKVDTDVLEHQYDWNVKQGEVDSVVDGHGKRLDMSNEEKQLQLNQEAFPRAENDKKSRKHWQRPGESGKKHSRCNELGKHQNAANIQLKESTVGSKHVMKHREEEVLPKWAGKILEWEIRFDEDRKDYQKEENVIFELLEEEKNVRELLEQGLTETTRKNGKEREKNERKPKDDLQREENERSLREDLEHQENESRLQEAIELEENERKLREAALSLEESERKQKETLEKEEITRREAAETIHQVKNDNRKRETIERDESDKKQKQDDEKQLTDPLHKEEKEQIPRVGGAKSEDMQKGQEEVLMREETEEKAIETFEQEEKRKIPIEAFEIDKVEKTPEEAVNEAQVVEDISKEFYNLELLQKLDEVIKETIISQPQEVEDDEMAREAECEKEEFRGDSEEADACEEMVMEHKTTSNGESKGENEAGQPHSAPSQACKLGEDEKLQEAEVAIGNQEAICCDGNGKAPSDPEFGGKLVAEKHQILEQGQTELVVEHSETKNKAQCDIPTGGASIRSASSLAANANDKVDRGNNVNKEESIDAGRRTEGAQPLASEVKESTYRTAHRATDSSHTIERKLKNLNQPLPLERTEAARLKREKDMETERLRKMEEEREREREREKDRMAVDRAILESREKAYAEVREKAERAAVERAMQEARERLEKACAEAREKSLSDKTAGDPNKLRAAEVRGRGFERAWVERSASYGGNNGLRQCSSSSSSSYDSQFVNATSANGYRNTSSSAHNGSYNGERSEAVEGESAERCKARLERYRRTAERAAKALADKNMRDIQAQREQAERDRFAEVLAAEVKRWSSGKEGNLRALLSTLQYILGAESGWQPIPLTEVITAAAVKRAYRKATLCVHPDKLQQRGASIQQKYVCEKVFDLLKEAWNRFNSEER